MNNYILERYQRIKDGTDIEGKNIVKWYEYIVKGLKKKSFYFDQKKANKAIKYIENFCHHHEGDLAPNLIELELWQKADLSIIFGIVDKTGLRQFREVIWVMGRKCGKSLLASACASYMAFLDGEYGARIYFVAPKLDQARICYDAFYQMIKAEPELNDLSKKRRTDIYIESTNTSIQPLPFNAKRSDGLNPHFICADELAAWQGDQGIKQYEVLKSALGARKQPMILSITTANYLDGIYDELMKRSTAVLNGTSKETRLAPFIYQIDDVLKWNDINELKKSMPNLGVSVSVDYMLEEIAIAEGSLSKKAEFLTKYCNIKQNSSVAWLDAQTIEKCYRKPLKLEDFSGCYGVLGIDLSRSTDLSACVLLVEKDGIINTFARFYLPANKIEEATARDKVPYQAYIQRGILFPSGENYIDYQDIYKWAVELIEKHKIYVLKVGYDRYSAQYLVNDMKAYGFHMDDVFQGWNLSSICYQTEAMMKDGKINIGDNDLLKIHFYNSALKINNENDRCQLIKVEARSHIDGMAAMLDAMCMRDKYWSEIGHQLVNERR